MAFLRQCLMEVRAHAQGMNHSTTRPFLTIERASANLKPAAPDVARFPCWTPSSADAELFKLVGAVSIGGYRPDQP